ncbi:MAG: hypothetical protein ACU837_17425, partial [Gammaproteobacteria bacterium]
FSGIMGSTEFQRIIKDSVCGRLEYSEQRAEILAAGMDGFVRKPYRSDEIYACLAKHLGVRYLYRGEPEAEPPLPALTPDMLSILPEGLRSELVDALESLDNNRIAQLILQVANYDRRLQKILAERAENFDYSTILTLLGSNSRKPEGHTPP